MTCILARGFENGSVYDFDYVSNSSFITSGTTYKRPGGYSNYGVLNQGSYIHRISLPAAKTEIYYQQAMSWASRLNSTHHIKWKSGSVVLGSLYYDNTLSIWKAYTGDAGTLVATGTSLIFSAVWYIIELYIKIADNPDGRITLRINGVEEFTFSGNTKPGAETSIDNIDGTGAATTQYWIDDIIINDTTGNAPGNTWPSGAYVSALVPTGASADGAGHTQWTPTTAPNWDCVNEVPAAIVDNVVTNAVDQMDTYTMGNLAAEAAVVLGVEESIAIMRVGLSTPTTIKPMLRIGGVDYPKSTGITVPLLSTFPCKNMWSQNPATTADWLVAAVNDMEVGFKSAA